MKKATLTIVMMIEEYPHNIESLNDLKDSVDNGEIAEGFNEETDGVTAEATLVIEDV